MVLRAVFRLAPAGDRRHREVGFSSGLKNLTPDPIHSPFCLHVETTDTAML
jgi:hypothetical protein